jgi:hypothetical protein
MYPCLPEGRGLIPPNPVKIFLYLRAKQKSAEVENMKTLKIGVMLLAFLLAAMAMVPMVSATGIIDGKSGSTGQNSLTIQFANPSILDEFGIQKDTVKENTVPLKGYKEGKAIIDKIMTKSNLSDSSNSIIGFYDFGDAQVVLLNHGATILEVTYDGNSVKQNTISPTLLGEKKTVRSPKVISSTVATPENFTINSEVVDQLYSFSIQSPKSPASVLTTYAVTKSRTDNYVNYGATWASVTAKGTFYVNYGSSITSITDESVYYTYAPYANCGFSSVKSGVGSTSGQVNGHLKSGSLYARIQMDNWVSCDAWLQTNDGGSQTTWISGYPDNCTG